MNRPAWFAVSLIAVAAVVTAPFGDVPVLSGFAPSFARAQAAKTPSVAPAAAPVPAAPAAIPAEAKTAPAPEAFRPQIEAFITGHLARLRSGDPKATTASREALVGEVSGTAPSAAYKDVYTQSLAASLLKLLDDQDVRVRVLAAVVAGRVAERADNGQLTPVAVRLLKDDNIGITIWGLKTARGVLGYQLKLPNGLTGSPVPQAVAAAVTAHPARPEIVRDAVDALHLDINVIREMKIQASVPALVPHALKVLSARAGVYRNPGLPDESVTDRLVLTFFSNAAWDGLTPEQRRDVMQNAMDMLLLTAAEGPNAGAAYRPVAEHTVAVGRNLLVIAQTLDRTSTPQTKAFLASTQSLTAGNVPPAAEELTKGANAVFDAARGVPGFTALQAPQKATTAPAK